MADSWVRIAPVLSLAAALLSEDRTVQKMVRIWQDALCLAPHEFSNSHPHAHQTTLVNYTCSLVQLVQLPPVLNYLATAPADSSKQRGTLHHW